VFTYGHRLKEIRKQLNMSQEEMALNLGLAPRTYAAYERNENKPTLSMLDMLNLNFDVNLNWLVSNKGEMFNSAPENSATQTKQDKKELAELIKETLIEMILEKGGQELLNKLLK
jgi:transcriptional regulator with XRE-family HTH domain